MTAAAGEEVRAAGGVVWHWGPPGEAGREQSASALEIVVVHRPAYDDWSLPKGKVDPGESDEDCARREVEEETGLRCRLGLELPSVRYRDRNGRDKVVRYWTMVATAGELAPRHEVDRARWLDVESARAVLTYAHDRDLVSSAARAIADAESR